MTPTNQIKTAIKIKVAEANEKYGINLNPDIRFDLKGRASGQAGYKGSKFYIRINPEAIEKGFDHVINNTVPHEVAHLVCYVKFPAERGHGRYWKTVSKNLGMRDVKRCHNIALTPTRKTRKFVYKLASGRMIEISSIRHNKIIKGQAYRVAGERLDRSCFVREA